MDYVLQVFSLLDNNYRESKCKVNVFLWLLSSEAHQMGLLSSEAHQMGCSPLCGHQENSETRHIPSYLAHYNQMSYQSCTSEISQLL